MADNIIQIEEMHKELQSLQPLTPENQQRLDKKFRLEFNYNSNHMEGNTLTYGETMLLIIFGKTEGQHDIREYEEMQAHDVAYALIKEWALEKERPLTETAIKTLNEIMLVRPFWKEAITPEGQTTHRLIKGGGYKELPNSVRLQNDEMFHYASVTDTPIQMGELIEWFRSEEEKQELHPVVLAALLHYRFVRIHPFDDGNGRISRLLMNYVLLKNGYPPVIIKSSAKKEYLFALNQADAGNLNAFVDYVSGQLLWSLDISIKAAKGESIEEADDIDKEIAVFKKSIDKSREKGLFKNIDILSTLLQCSIAPLFEQLRSKLLRFNDLFFEQESRLVYVFPDYSGWIAKKLEMWFKILDSKVSVSDIMKELSIEKDDELILDIGLEIFQISFKTAPHFDVAFLLNVAFSRFHYSISYSFSRRPSIKLVEKEYGQELTSEDILFIVNASAREILDYVKAKANSNSNEKN